MRIPVLTFLLFSVSTANAATYFVNTATGNDANSTAQAQNPATPWLTLQHANDTATDGDTIHAQTGTYVETSANSAFRLTKRLTWIADGGLVTVQPSAPASTAFSTGTVGATGSAFTGFVFDALGTKASCFVIAAGTSNMVFSGCTFKDATTQLLLSGSTNTIGFTWTNCTFSTSAGRIFFQCTAGATIKNSTFNVAGTQFLQDLSTNGLVFAGNMVNYSASSSYVFNIRNGGAITVTNNTFNLSGTPTSFWVIDGSSATTGSLLLSANVITNSAVFSAAGFTKTAAPVWTAIITGNTFGVGGAAQAQNLVSLTDYTSALAAGNTVIVDSTNSYAPIYASATTVTSAVTITNNTIYWKGRTGYGIGVGTENSSAANNLLDGAVIQGNRLFGSRYWNPALTVSTHGLFVGWNKNANVYGNLVDGAGFGIVLKSGGENYASGGVFYNIVVNCLSDGIYMKGASSVPVYNNVVYADPSLTPRNGIHFGVNNSAIECSTNGVAKNNVVFQNPNTIYGAINLDADSTNGFASSHNCFWCVTDVPQFTAGASTMSFTDWQALGYDSLSRVTDPKFLSVTNFVPQAFSPLVRAGVGVGQLFDFAGNAVPSTPDAGAYQWQALSVPVRIWINPISVAQ